MVVRIKWKMTLGEICVSEMFDSEFYIASYPFKEDFVKLGKSKVKNQLKGISKGQIIEG